MRRPVWIVAFLVALVAGGRGKGSEPCGPDRPLESFLARVCPAGGWFPYGGGLLHWWDPHCFPCVGGPDDYCRKSLPCVCPPPCPPSIPRQTPVPETPTR
jgi:hypothetical protein